MQLQINHLKIFVIFFVALTFSNFVFTQPVINSVSPLTGLTGTTITIKGTGFGNLPDSNIVFFGAVKAKIISASDSLIEAKLPVGATYQPVSVTENKLTGFSSQSVVITFKGSGGIAPNSFASKIDFPAGRYPREMIVCDLDMDKKPDIVMINGNDSLIAVYKNLSTTGNISFANVANYSTGNNPFGIAAGDFNGDGKQDIAVCNNNDNTVSIFKNSSTRSNIIFDTPINFQTADNPISITVSDFDNDGKPDIAVVNSNSNSISVLRNITAKKISFDNKVDFPAGNWPMGICSGDLNGDGKTDIAVTNFNDNTISVFKNASKQGKMIFESKLIFQTGDGPWHPVIADVNDDQKPELIIPNSNSNSISIFKNISKENKIAFSTKKDYVTGELPLNIAVGDIDGDEKPDIAVSDFSIFSNAVSVFKNIGNDERISFKSKVDFGTANSPRGIIMDDFDGDGKPDLAVSNSNSNSLSVLQNQVLSNAVLFSGTVISNTSANKAILQIQPTVSNGNFSVHTFLPVKKLSTSFTLYNSLGKIIWQQYAGKTCSTIDQNFRLENVLSNGVYFLHVTRSDTHLITKIIICK